MKLFTKEVDSKLFQQYQLGSDLKSQKVVAKIFNPYGRGTWYLLNSDPQDPDYIWAIVDLFEVEMGSISRSELESIKVPPFGLGLERDLSFTPINAHELYMGLLGGKQYSEGGSVHNIEKYLSKNLINHIGSLDKEQLTKMKKELSDEISRSEKYDKDFKGSNREFSLNKELDFVNYRLEEKFEVGGQTSLFEEGGSVAQQNKQMLKNQAKEFTHHSKELNSLVDKTNQVDAWVVAKAERASTDLSDITHYLDGRMMAKGGNVINIKEIEKEYKENENNNLHSENVVLLAENFGTKEELSEAKDILKQHEEQGSLSTELRKRRSDLEDVLWKKFQTMKKISMAKGGKTTFKDKVNAISKRLEGTKVPAKLKKEYGATYDKKEAKKAGQRIVGSMIKKLKMRNK